MSLSESPTPFRVNFQHLLSWIPRSNAKTASSENGTFFPLLTMNVFFPALAMSKFLGIPWAKDPSSESLLTRPVESSLHPKCSQSPSPWKSRAGGPGVPGRWRLCVVCYGIPRAKRSVRHSTDVNVRGISDQRTEFWGQTNGRQGK